MNLEKTTTAESPSGAAVTRRGVRWAVALGAIVFAVAGVLTAGGLPTAPATASVERPDVPRDPAPHGPQRPHEPDVDGPLNADGLEASISRVPGVRGGVEVTFARTSAAASGRHERPAPARRFVIMFDQDIRLNTWAFPTCDLRALHADGPSACPAGSRIGGGEYLPWTSPSEPEVDPAEVYVFNGRADGRPALYVWTSGVTLVQTIEQVVGDYRKDFRIGLDEILPPDETPPLDRSVSARFVLDFGATTTVHGKKVSFLETSNHRPGHDYEFGYWTEFVTGQRQVTRAEASLDGGAR